MQIPGFSRFFTMLAISGATFLIGHSASAWVECQPPGYGCPDSSSYGYGGERLPPAVAIVNSPLTRVDNGYWPAFPWNRGRGGTARRVAEGYGRQPGVYSDGYNSAPYWNDGGYASEQNYGIDGPYDFGGPVARGVMVEEGGYAMPAVHRVHRVPPVRGPARPVRFQPAPSRAVGTPSHASGGNGGFHDHDPMLGKPEPGTGKGPLDLPAPSWVTEGG